MILAGLNWHRERGLGGRSAREWCAALGAALTLVGAAASAAANTIGLIGDGGSNRVIVFDADTGALITEIPLEVPVRDVLVMPDQSLGFALGEFGKVFVIDLRANPPKLATAPPANPIVTLALGRDLALSADEKYLLVSGAGVGIDERIAVIDIATRLEVGPFDSDSPGQIGLDTCRDGSVLVAGTLRTVLLLLDTEGDLTDSGDALAEAATDVVCAPNGRSAVQVHAAVPPALSTLESFRLPTENELNIVSVTQLRGPDADELGADLGVPSTLAFHPSGERLFVRGSGVDETGDVLTVFEYEPRTGAIGERVTSVTTPDGMVISAGLEQIAVHPDGGSLYVPVPGRLDVYDSGSLALLASVTGLSSGVATRSVALSARSDEIRIRVNTEPLNGLGWLHPLRGSLVSLALLGSSRFSPALVDEKSVRFGPKNAKPLLAGQLTDVNGDSINDLVLLFRRRDMRIGARGVEHCASGRLSNRARFLGCQWLRAGGD
jgi:DNA-binding beta-propeller fold protein YncE